jgi:threonylcarbamoyladenosine tRNA methylthiotransferase MtaB
MRRRYLAADYRRLLDAIRSAVPGVAITTDVMVGFPGETEDEFESSRQFVSEAQFAGIHVFPYSARRRTAAAKLPDQVSPEEKHRRTDVMLAIASESARDFRRRFVGKTLPTLFEGRSNGSPDQAPNWDGLTDNYLRVRVTAPGQLDNTILETRIVEVADDCVLGEIAEPIPVDGASPPERRTWTRLPLTSASR